MQLSTARPARDVALHCSAPMKLTSKPGAEADNLTETTKPTVNLSPGWLRELYLARRTSGADTQGNAEGARA